MTTLIEIKDTEDFLTGNVGQTDIPFDWWISAADDLVILVDGNPATFTVAAQYIKNNDGGFAVLDSALSGGEDIAIYRSTEIGRDVIYSNDLRPLTMNNEGAKHIAIMQELKRNSDKKIGYPEGTNVTTPQLPTPSDGKAIVFDGNTGALRASNVNIDDLDTTIADIIALEAAASASATTASNQATAAAGSATDAQSAKTDAEAARDTALASIGTVKATAADTTPKPLNDILAAGQLCFKSVTNPGGDETLAFGVSIADQATAEAGTSDAVAMTPRGTKQAIAALVNLEPDYQSPQTTITNGTTATFAHGQGVRPSLIQLWAVCITADDGFAVGSWLLMSNGLTSVSSTQGMSVVADDTNISVAYGNTTFQAAIRQDTQAVVSLDDANWELVVKAWV